VSIYDAVSTAKFLPAGSGVDAGVTPGASVYDAVSAVNDAALVGYAERP
jgi:hypothetical protein